MSPAVNALGNELAYGCILASLQVLCKVVYIHTLPMYRVWHSRHMYRVASSAPALNHGNLGSDFFGFFDG